MTLSIKDAETGELARKLARLTGQTIKNATKQAIEERLRRIGGSSRKTVLLEDLADIRRRWSAMPVLDEKTSEDVIGYDKDGLPR